MDSLIKFENAVINTNAIHAGDFIRAKYHSWPEERNGLVTDVTSDKIRVIWQPGIRNVTNFFIIFAEEIAAGQWAVKWSPDMEAIHVVGIDAESATGGDSGTGE